MLQTKWTPARRQVHAPIKGSSACFHFAGTEHGFAKRERPARGNKLAAGTRLEDEPDAGCSTRLAPAFIAYLFSHKILSDSCGDGRALRGRMAAIPRITSCRQPPYP